MEVVRNVHEILIGDLNGRDHLGDVDGRIILKLSY
jgi:hypothetical protein